MADLRHVAAQRLSVRARVHAARTPGRARVSMQQLPLAIGLRERAVFESFVPGLNVEAVEHLRAIAQGDGAGVCWLCGPAGVGKSHLLQAVCALAQRTGITAAYLPLAQLRPHGPEALEGWHGVRVLALDELGQIAGDLPELIKREHPHAVPALQSLG